MATMTSLFTTIESCDIISLRHLLEPPCIGKVPRHVDAVTRCISGVAL